MSIKQDIHPVLARRMARQWSQAELARRAGISRTAVSAIEGERLVPSVQAALSLAAALECSVEELFAGKRVVSDEAADWAWSPPAGMCRYWEAEINGRRWLYPVEALGVNPTPHDGVLAEGIWRELKPAPAETTLTLACCDPAAGLMAAEYARMSGFRLLVFPRGGSAALDLLREGLVHVAGLHRSTAADPNRNAQTVRKKLGINYRLLQAAQWEEGIALSADQRAQGAASVIKEARRWALREPGSAARECLEELFAGKRVSGRQVGGHAEVAQAVRGGWAEAGVCVRLCAEEARLKFVPVRTETLDFCFANATQHDPRVQALVRLLRLRSFRRLLSELPGYDSRHTGEMQCLSDHP